MYCSPGFRPEAVFRTTITITTTIIRMSGLTYTENYCSTDLATWQKITKFKRSLVSEEKAIIKVKAL